MADLRAEPGRAFAPLLRRQIKPVVARPLADEVFVFHAPPGRGEVDCAEDIARGILVLDDECALDLVGDLANHRLHQLHHCLVVAVGLISLEHGELRVVLAGQALVAEVAADLENPVDAAYQ